MSRERKVDERYIDERQDTFSYFDYSNGFYTTQVFDDDWTMEEAVRDFLHCNIDAVSMSFCMVARTMANKHVKSSHYINDKQYYRPSVTR